MYREHPFERYGAFTDVAALKEWSAKPLRKSVRVNTLKCSVERFREWAKERGWKLEPVPWCKEGFFVDQPSLPEGELRPASRLFPPLGKDLLHLIGGFYIQEAASMLPVELLGVQPGESVLDMSAAPGSKTTQIAAKMEGVTSPLTMTHGRKSITGVLLANDIQEHRLWTLKSSLHRSGVTNAIVTKKVGQWFSKHMAERFDRVLCDVPCTAQGTIRKDSDALNYCGRENVEKMARLQTQLLETAIHAAKVDGRIVYSTCTLTPEENEGVVMHILEKFADQLEVIDPGPWHTPWNPPMTCPLTDSVTVQKHLGTKRVYPLLRLWPQTYDTEGFFCVVLEKRAPTREVAQMEWVPFQEERLSASGQNEIVTKLENLYGTDFLREGDVLFQLGEQLFLTSEKVTEFPLPVQDYSVGIPFAKILRDSRVRLSHEMALLRGREAKRARCSIDDQQLALLLKGKDAPGDPELRGDVLLIYKDFCIGRALAKNGMLKNNLPRWMVRD